MKIAKAMGVKFDETRPVSNKYNVVQYQTTHIQGGAVMGTSPENSVVNTNLQHWNVPNLWVIGASAFPQTASGNPTLTALALTYRAADAFIAPHAARSLREIQLQASLDHPNIAAVHNAFWVGEDLVLVMELIDGRSLRRVPGPTGPGR